MKKIPEMTHSQIVRFWSKINQTMEPSECWNWRGALSYDGYGLVWINGNKYRTNRIAHYLNYGVDPGELYLCHSCDNRACCDPSHGWLGTHIDNMRDRDKKGRTKRAICMNKKKKKLTINYRWYTFLNRRIKWLSI